MQVAVKGCTYIALRHFILLVFVIIARKVSFYLVFYIL
jgi:hypothetical protein